MDNGFDAFDNGSNINGEATGNHLENHAVVSDLIEFRTERADRGCGLIRCAVARGKLQSNRSSN